MPSLRQQRGGEAPERHDDGVGRDAPGTRRRRRSPGPATASIGSTVVAIVEAHAARRAGGGKALRELVAVADLVALEVKRARQRRRRVASSAGSSSTQRATSTRS